MRASTTLRQNEAAIEYVPATILQPLDFAEVFGREAPVEVDIGCGNGTFVTALAAQKPERNFLGIERLAGRIRSVCRNAASLELANVRVLRIDALHALAQLIPPASVEILHLLFPDPWPKRRHHRRRTVTDEFVAAVHRALVPDGLFHIATDHPEYFQLIERLILSRFEAAPRNEPFPKSTFEQRFAVRGLEIHRLLLRKTSPVK
jgi:tRNA (guanine-N7-)-methyltransferase